MDTNTSGEELLTKTRKPYTITKQRERWTDDEHDKFLEALRLYGRAWQRIEDHIGTKTAVQIRSHAQKFFTKLEKEAEAKGIPVCKALDIEIPPPRPKRKPNTPYPKKPGNNGASSSQVSSAKDSKLVSSAGKENQDDNSSGVSTLNKYPLPENPNTFMESEASLNKGSGINETSVNNAVQDLPKRNKDRVTNDGTMHSVQNYPQEFMFRPMGEDIHGHTNPQATTSSATTTTSHQAFPACHSLDDYRFFLHVSSTFSNLVMSTLLQNPAAHAAATFAASVWPYSGNSSTQMSSSPPNVAAITAATVAAATAWWASHGLLPLCAPTPATFLPLPTVAVPTPTMNKMDTVENEKQSTALQDKKLASKSPPSSSDNSEQTGLTKLNADGDKAEEVVVAAAEHDLNTIQNKKLVDRSSCGSNAPSGSDLETDRMEKDEENVMETDRNQPGIVELCNRRIKINNNNNNPITDSWKEVSEEGRIAFQALFARERLPQSFSPENVNGRQKSDNLSLSLTKSTPLTPNFKIQDSCDAEQESVVLTMMSVGSSKSLQTRQTGFKPYKRCSMEVKEGQVGNTNIQSDEKVCKRLRLEGEAST